MGVAVTILSGNAGLGSGGGGSVVGSLIKVLLGLLLVGLAVREFRNRPRPGQQPKLPGWMRTIESITGAKALGIAVLLSAINPKNLSLTVAAGVTVAKEGLTAASAAFVLALFVILASLGIAVPVALYFLGGASAARALDSRGRG